MEVKEMDKGQEHLDDADGEEQRVGNGVFGRISGISHLSPKRTSIRSKVGDGMAISTLPVNTLCDTSAPCHRIPAGSTIRGLPFRQAEPATLG